MTAAEAAGAWVEGWSRAWPTTDIEAVAALYAEDAVFVSLPFRDPQPPRDYAAWAFADQAAAECRFGEPLVTGDRAAVEWWGAITTRDAGVATVAGVSLLRFAADGRVIEQRDVWALAPGNVEAPHWAQ